MRLRFAVAASLVAGCFSPDLGDGKIVCGSGGSCPAEYVCRADNHCWKSGGTGSDGGSDDMSSSSSCARRCPPTSACADAICQPPPGATMCQRAADCSGGQVCTPFNVRGQVKFLCAPPLPGASGGSSARCASEGTDTSCTSGYCVTDGNDSSVHLCLVPCLAQSDCGGTNCDPANPIGVEGVTTLAFRVCALP